jgi:hypothetical protein
MWLANITLWLWKRKYSRWHPRLGGSSAFHKNTRFTYFPEMWGENSFYKHFNVFILMITLLRRMVSVTSLAHLEEVWFMGPLCFIASKCLYVLVQLSGIASSRLACYLT